MLNHKNFIDINRFQTKYHECFEIGDIIQISEKLDGSNASVQYDDESDTLRCFSRKLPLTPENTLSGFYEYVQRLDKEFFKKYKNYRFFGEWNLKHLVKYQSEMIKKFHCFDIYDTLNERWMPQDFVQNVCKEGNILTAPVFYSGEFISWEHVQNFIGKTIFGLEHGEGIVVKNQTKLNNPNTRQPFVFKLISTEYQETSQTKIREPISEDELARIQYVNDLTASIITKNRVEKALYKLIMNGELQENWDENDMGFIAKTLPRIIYNDCIKEENDIVMKIDNFGKLCNKHTMNWVKQLLEEK